MSSLFKTSVLLLFLLLFIFPLVYSNVEIVAQGLPPTRGFYLSIGTLPNSNIISISTGEIDAYDDTWVNPDTEIDWYYYVNSSGVHLLGAECYTPSYLMCPRLNLNVSENLVRFRTKTKFVKGVPVNGSILFNFGKSTYKVPVSKILPYIWGKSWVEHLWSYEINGSLIFFPKVVIEIRGANFRYQNCSIENGSMAVTRLIQKYNVTYYIKTSWKRSKIKSETMNQYELLQLLKKPLYVFFYNGTFKAFKAGKIDFEYSTVLITSNNTTSVFVKPHFYYSNSVLPNAIYSHGKGDNTLLPLEEASSTLCPTVSPSNTTYPRAGSITPSRQDKHGFWPWVLITLLAVVIACLLYKKRGDTNEIE